MPIINSEDDKPFVPDYCTVLDLFPETVRNKILDRLHKLEAIEFKYGTEYLQNWIAKIFKLYGNNLFESNKERIEYEVTLFAVSLLYGKKQEAERLNSLFSKETDAVTT